MDGYTYTYDRAGNRTARTNTLNSAFSETYTYDDLNRLVDANRNGSDLQDWTLDALGNWAGFTDGTNGQTRTHNAANETTDIDTSWIDPTYDAAGNMSSGPKAGAETTRLHFVYDAWNRLVAVKADNNGQPGSTVATYAYDGIGRRVSKTVGSDTFDFYYNEQYQVLEVRKNGDTDPYEQYVYDVRYIDAPVMVYRDTDTDGASIQKVYVIQDANFNVTAILSGDNGTVINRFVYTPYGRRTVLDTSWTAGTTDFMLGHQGLMLDSESGLYYNRARYYHPTLGTFTTRDPLGYVDGIGLYQYEGGVPTIRTDPSGREFGIVPPIELPGPDDEPIDIIGGNPVGYIPADGQYIPPGSAMDLIKWIAKKANGRCVSHLYLSFHGAPDLIQVNPQPGENWNGGTDLENANVITWVNAAVFASELAKQVRFCKPCQIYIGACNLAGNPKNEVATAIAQATGCTVYAPTKAIANNLGCGRKPLGIPIDPGGCWWRIRPRPTTGPTTGPCEP